MQIKGKSNKYIGSTDTVANIEFYDKNDEKWLNQLGYKTESYTPQVDTFGKHFVKIIN